MQRMGATSRAVGDAAGSVLIHPLTGSARSRVQAIAETLSYPADRGPADRDGETVSGLAHDARNMVQALALYCDLLEEPGVLSAACRHYAGELRLVAASSRRLVEKLALLGKRETATATRAGNRFGATRPVALSLNVPEQPIADLRAELLGLESLLSALAGPSVTVTVAADEGARPVWLTVEDLTRVLVNLVKNATEAMHGASIQDSAAKETGRIRITLRERAASADAPLAVLVSVEDSGPGIDPSQLEAVFEPGFTTNGAAHAHGEGSQPAAWPAAHRGLGLFICRSIVEAAGGRMLAGNRGENGIGGGARIEIELPVRSE